MNYVIAGACIGARSDGGRENICVDAAGGERRRSDRVSAVAALDGRTPGGDSWREVRVSVELLPFRDHLPAQLKARNISCHAPCAAIATSKCVCHVTANTYHAMRVLVCCTEQEGFSWGRRERRECGRRSGGAGTRSPGNNGCW
jgi:hypothetical protein